MKNKMQDLRDNLFVMLENVMDPDVKIDKERYTLGANIAQTIINSVKVEVDFLRVTDSVRGTGFIPSDASQLPAKNSSAPLAITSEPHHRK